MVWHGRADGSMWGNWKAEQITDLDSDLDLQTGFEIELPGPIDGEALAGINMSFVAPLLLV